MAVQPVRAIHVAFATASVMLALAMIVVAGRAGAQGSPFNEFTVEILPDRFNPETCVVPRAVSGPKSTIVFWNRDSRQRRVIKPSPNSSSDEPLLDTGIIEPGERSGVWGPFEFLDDFVIYDPAVPAIQGRIVIPISNTATADCTPEAVSLPSPSPRTSPSPSVTTTPTASPTVGDPPRADRHPRCSGAIGTPPKTKEGCAIGVFISAQ